ncbi:MAG: CarD family transcriptional regulator [Proteobacteria bacterium]|nr:CarD family transcriptional regulator [Pseudomonadota bacterium]
MATAKGKNEFSVGDAVVYPAHGVGKITGEETQVIGGITMQLYVITFSEDRMILRVPKTKVEKSGLRHLSSTDELSQVLKILQGQAKIPRRVMWSKRAQEYEAKINSGNPASIAEVVRDLHVNVDDPERSYSERVIYEMALERLIAEYAVAAAISKDDAKKTIIDALSIANLPG